MKNINMAVEAASVKLDNTRAAKEAAAAGCDAAYAVLADILPRETVTPADVDVDMFHKEHARIERLEKANSDLKYRWERIQARIWVAVENVHNAEKVSRIAKGMATKARKAYTGEPTPERYSKMTERVRHAHVAVHQLAKRRQEMEKALRTEEEFATYWVAEDALLKELMSDAQAKLETAKLARRHERRQEALEDAFSQRYERAEFIPEKEDAFRYKVYSISAKALHGPAALSILDKMAALAEEKPAGYVQQGQVLYAQYAAMLRAAQGPFVVDAKECVVNNVTASAMSDIMGVEYGLKTPCKEIVQVNYDLTGTLKIYWKFVDSTSYETANAKLHNLRVFVAERLIRDGLDLVDNGKELSYCLLASNNSQQKKGQAYMGEAETMKRTEKLREFGWSMEDAITRRTDNSAEWLKRNATLTTPSKIIKSKDGETVSIKRVLMMDDVDIERWFDNVTTVSGKKLTKGERKKLKLTMFDGQALWLKDGFATTQGRGAALKFMAIAMPNYELPEYTPDGRKVSDYDILMTRSCWKASKMGQTWDEFVQTVCNLAEVCPGYDLLRSVRYSDREIGDEENPRNLARQATQQWAKVDDEDVDGLTRKTRRWLKNQKKYRVILRDLGEWDKPEEERSALARLFNRCPQLAMHPYIQQWLKNAWTAKRDKACSGRLRSEGMYPYICQDPIAMIQILLEGRSPMDTNLGVVPEGKVNLPKVTTGRKVYCVRYPANYLVGMVLEQVNCLEFFDLGNVAVLSYYGDTITRADGDFDGDEMLFLFDELIIKLMEKTIRTFNPGLVDFPHGKVPCNQPFGSEKNFIRQIAEALTRAQEYNLVGLYSNLAVICLQQASLSKDGVTCGKWMNAAIFAHVGAIICLDMVKGADPGEELVNKLDNLNEKIRDVYKMPWNQLFSHKELTPKDVAPRSNSTQDRIAGLVFDDCGEFAVDFEDEAPVECTENFLRRLMPTFETTTFRNMVVSEDVLRRMRGCRFEDDNDARTWEAMEKGESVALKSWLLLGWHSSSALLWKMSGVDMAEKRAELYALVREAVIANVRDNEWVGKDGRVWTKTEKYASLVKNVAGMALGFWVTSAGEFKRTKGSVDEDKTGSWAIFLLKVFAEDILAVMNGLTEESVKAMLEKKEEVQIELDFLDDIAPDELTAILNDGSIWLSCDD